MLETLPYPEDTLRAGDFNATYWSWAPGTRLSHHNPQIGDRIAGLASEHGLVQHIEGKATHEADNTLDLVMCNVAGTAAWVKEDMYTGSDHYTIRITVPFRRPRPVGKSVKPDKPAGVRRHHQGRDGQDPDPQHAGD
ncbi:hypothetical protein GGS21DRAFT_529569 [Xylaria nigripes]|nr:hypothetical protein GGS21DRAFT_529569 [Xylaria nigripes]